MAWVKIDDNAPHHRKQLAAGDVACWLWVCGLAYCQKHATDGLIPSTAIPFLGCTGWKPAVSKLVDAGLWVPDDPHGYRVHDFLTWNDSAASRKAKIAESAERVARYRQSKRGEVKRESNSVTPLPTGNACNTTPLPTPQPQPIPIKEPAKNAGSPRASADERVQFVSPAKWDKQHGQHVAGFCAWVCFPQDVFDEFVRRVMVAGSDEVEAIRGVKAWADDVKARWPKGKIPGANIFDFWRNEWEKTHGTNKPVSSPAFADPLAGLREAERRG